MIKKGGKKYMIYRQGDILLLPINNIPEKVKKKDLILAYGEATGHMHQFIDSVNVSVYELNQQQFVNINSEYTDLIHNEHNTLKIPRGMYKVVNQREVDLTNEIRQVLD